MDFLSVDKIRSHPVYYVKTDYALDADSSARKLVLKHHLTHIDPDSEWEYRQAG